MLENKHFHKKNNLPLHNTLMKHLIFYLMKYMFIMHIIFCYQVELGG